MVKLLIIADDFTGALDTGVQFAASGASTRVVTDVQVDYKLVDPEVLVLVLDAETRHLKPVEAGQVVAKVVRQARAAGVSYIYKKTDSALRGNIGAELEALCKETGGRIHFLPAFPQLGRITKNGIQYVDGLPVSDSVFGKDPFEPVKHSQLIDILAEQTDLPVALMGTVLPDKENLPEGILVYDSETSAQMENLARGILQEGELHYCAGCAGFASVLPHLLGLEGRRCETPKLPVELLVVCGSVNPITVAQLDNAERMGVPRIRLTLENKLNPAWPYSPEALKQLQIWKQQCLSSGALILDSNDRPGKLDTKTYCRGNDYTLGKMRNMIAQNMGALVRQLLDLGLNATLMITGGDTLLGFMQQVGVSELAPIGEVTTGVVLSSFNYAAKKYCVITKSGGFGNENFVEELKRYIVDQNTERGKVVC